MHVQNTEVPAIMANIVWGRKKKKKGTCREKKKNHNSKEMKTWDKQSEETNTLSNEGRWQDKYWSELHSWNEFALLIKT